MNAVCLSIIVEPSCWAIKEPCLRWEHPLEFGTGCPRSLSEEFVLFHESIFNRNLYELLNIVNNGDLVRLEAFFGKAGDVLTQYQLSADVLKEHCRLLALTKLCSGCQQMSYSEIAHSLNVTPAEAEVFIVLAIQYGLIQGRMDQIKEEFTVL